MVSIPSILILPTVYEQCRKKEKLKNKETLQSLKHWFLRKVWLVAQSLLEFPSKPGYFITLLSIGNGIHSKSEKTRSYFQVQMATFPHPWPFSLSPWKSHFLTESSRIVTSAVKDFPALSSTLSSLPLHTLPSAALLRQRLSKAVNITQHTTHCPHFAPGYRFLLISFLISKLIPTGDITMPLINPFWTNYM